MLMGYMISKKDMGGDSDVDNLTDTVLSLFYEPSLNVIYTYGVVILLQSRLFIMDEQNWCVTLSSISSCALRDDGMSR